MEFYRDRPETVTNHGPALPPLLSEAWRGAEAWREDRAALHHLGLQAPQADLRHRGRCPVLRWGSTTLKWGSVGACLPLLLTKAWKLPRTNKTVPRYSIWIKIFLLEIFVLLMFIIAVWVMKAHWVHANPTHTLQIHGNISGWSWYWQTGSSSKNLLFF